MNPFFSITVKDIQGLDDVYIFGKKISTKLRLTMPHNDIEGQIKITCFVKSRR